MLISDFARLGQVSVRMLRHYDALGLLVPDHVEPASGYRSYSPEQLHLLNRLVALKDLGFTVDRHVSPRPPLSAASTSARWRVSRSRGSPCTAGSPTTDIATTARVVSSTCGPSPTTGPTGSPSSSNP